MSTQVITKEFQLSKSEYSRALRRILLRRSATGILFLWLIAGYLALGSASGYSAETFWVVLAGWYPLLLFASAWTLWALVIAPWRMSNSRYSRPAYQTHRYRFGDDGITVETEDGSRTTRPYGAVIAVEQTPELVLLQQDSGQYFVLPRLAFPDQAALESVLARFSPHSVATTDDKSVAETDVPRYGLWEGLKRNLIAGLRLASFRRIEKNNFTATTDQVLLLVLATGIISIGVGYLGVNGPVEFSSYALLEIATSYLLLLIGAYLVTRNRDKLPALALFLVVLLSPEPLFEVVTSVLDKRMMGLDKHWIAWLIFLGLFVWIVAVWWRAVRIVFMTDRLRTSGAVALLCAITIPPQFLLPRSDFWYSSATTAQESIPDPVNVEDVFYSQPRLLEQALEPLRNERPGTVDLYHIGFGSYAHQEVFRREVHHVRDILDKRFDTRGRSLLLINNAQTVDQVPIASRTNLEFALHGVAERMNPDEDVLFLYLTSHGSKSAELSVNFRPLRLNPLSAGGLRRLLDEAGVRWRVVIISACYSGSFIDALKDDNTLVITAADKNRTSFGCSNENEYTYFGEAYFKHALTDTFSFADAYEIARKRVAEREQGEGREPSLPVLHVGKAIEAHLRQLEQRLALNLESSVDRFELELTQ